MKTVGLALSFALAFAVSATSPAADTWIVDDDGGPGIDFVDIQSAVEAAAPGDLVRVLATGRGLGGTRLPAIGE